MLIDRKENVYLFVPNIIGYIRVVTAATALYIMPSHPKVCTAVYFVSCILDVFDGMAARALGQTSKFGAVLDMVTDRCATACLLCFLSSTYPEHSLLIMFLITLDFSSHYIHMYSCVSVTTRR
jgi:CDP-diacylglycerol--inositol 3-phosphatidyltransferase